MMSPTSGAARGSRSCAIALMARQYACPPTNTTPSYSPCTPARPPCSPCHQAVSSMTAQPTERGLPRRESPCEFCPSMAPRQGRKGTRPRSNLRCEPHCVCRFKVHVGQSARGTVLTIRSRKVGIDEGAPERLVSRLGHRSEIRDAGEAGTIGGAATTPSNTPVRRLASEMFISRQYYRQTDPGSIILRHGKHSV